MIQKKQRKREVRNYYMLVLFMGIIFVIPFFILSPYYLSIMIFVAINSILVVSLNLLMGYTGQVSLGHAAFYGLGAYISGILSSKLGISPWLALPAAVFSTGIMAFIIGGACLRLKGYYLVMATLGFGLILQIIFVHFVSLTGGPSGISGIPVFSLFGFSLSNDFRYYYFVWTFVGLVLLLSFNIVDSRIGRAYRAIDSDETAAESLGINTFLYKLQVFVIAGFLAGLAGSLYCHYITFISPGTFSFMFSVELVVMVLVGGVRNTWGAFLGAVVFTILPEYLRTYKDFDVIIYGAVLILIVIFLPGGLISILNTPLARKARITKMLKYSQN